MAKSKNNNPILLGYEDDLLIDKHTGLVGYWTNKVGGSPDWPVEGILSPFCKLCGLKQPLIVQIYAPLENSSFHRTLYVFGCINPNCWNHNESWTCYRSQILDTEVFTTGSDKIKCNTDWCLGADDWDDDNGNVKNGNIINPTNQFSHSDNDSSEDDSSSLASAIGTLNVNECNANWDNLENSSGAVGKHKSPVASAEIEKEESEVVSIDSPIIPQKDLRILMQEVAPLPYFIRSGETNLNYSVSFVPFFISVGEEGTTGFYSDHVIDLLQEYQRNHGDLFYQNSGQVKEGNDSVSEEYEKSVPAHGDKLFHYFLNRIQSNPGQILRYNRDSEPPLLLYPLVEFPKKCKYCNGDLVFEFQLLPTLVNKLKFFDEDETRIEFGTVLIFTCKMSCWIVDDKYREETVIVQVENT